MSRCLQERGAGSGPSLPCLFVQVVFVMSDVIGQRATISSDVTERRTCRYDSCDSDGIKATVT